MTVDSSSSLAIVAAAVTDCVLRTRFLRVGLSPVEGGYAYVAEQWAYGARLDVIVVAHARAYARKGGRWGGETRSRLLSSESELPEHAHDDLRARGSLNNVSKGQIRSRCQVCCPQSAYVNFEGNGVGSKSSLHAAFERAGLDSNQRPWMSNPLPSRFLGFC
jgi:hypothetical protein